MDCPYGCLKEDLTDDNEIQTDKELRKIKKKLRSLKQKGDIEGSRKLEILINEYENNQNKTTNQKTTKAAKSDKTTKTANNESDRFLEKEYQKNKAKNAKKYTEQREKEQRDKKADEERGNREEQRRSEEREYNRVNQRVNQMSRNERIMNNHGLKGSELPRDILEIIANYSPILWKKLSLKYHPDKYDGPDKYSKLLNCLKDDNQL
tara:strand:- start:183 stop:803 length:621 start_codon:yes stop_codon:yes gene_type:complete